MAKHHRFRGTNRLPTRSAQETQPEGTERQTTQEQEYTSPADLQIATPTSERTPTSPIQQKAEESDGDAKDQGKSTDRLSKAPFSPAAPPNNNKNGLPNPIKSGVEELSGFSMDEVKVHYNSSKPKTLGALAYTQGSNIHVAPGQEKHLPHEAWHVVQQMQGRVKPTIQAKGRPVNDDPGLEREADRMGSKAVLHRGKEVKEPFQLREKHRNPSIELPIQRKLEINFRGKDVTMQIEDLAKRKDIGKYFAELNLLDELARYLRNQYPGWEDEEKSIRSSETLEDIADKLKAQTGTAIHEQRTADLHERHEDLKTRAQQSLARQKEEKRDKIKNKGSSDNAFLQYFTLLPGLKYSFLAQKLKGNGPDGLNQYTSLKNEYQAKYLSVRDNFLAEYKREATEHNYNIDFFQHLFPGVSLSKGGLDLMDKDAVKVLWSLNVMAPRVKADADLINALDQINTALNNELASLTQEVTGMDDPKIGGASGQAQQVQDQGGMVGTHADAFSEILKARESSSVFIRPAGEHAVKKLDEGYAAKPLWIKGKTADLSKLTLDQKKLLYMYLESSPVKDLDEEIITTTLRTKITEGLIPKDQTLSKWLKAISIKPIKVKLNFNTTLELVKFKASMSGLRKSRPHEETTSNPPPQKSEAKRPEAKKALLAGMRAAIEYHKLAKDEMESQIMEVEKEAKETNAVIEDMDDVGLVEARDEKGQKIQSKQESQEKAGYVASPGEENSPQKPYTGDYDLYSISHASSAADKLKEINHLREAGRRGGKKEYEEGDMGTDGKINRDAYSSIKDQHAAKKKQFEGAKNDVPDVPEFHILFGNISRFEMGMMIDLNAAAIKRGGYTGGQVIKHGAEAGNVKYPQEIDDGIVEVSQGGSSFSTGIVDEQKVHDKKIGKSGAVELEEDGKTPKKGAFKQSGNRGLALAHLAMESKGKVMAINPVLRDYVAKVRVKEDWQEAVKTGDIWREGQEELDMGKVHQVAAGLKEEDVDFNKDAQIKTVKQ